MKVEEPLKIGDRVRFPFFDSIKTGTITEINDGLYVADFDEPMSLLKYEDSHMVYYMEPTRFIKAGGTAEYFKKIK